MSEFDFLVQRPCTSLQVVFGSLLDLVSIQVLLSVVILLITRSSNFSRLQERTGTNRRRPRFSRNGEETRPRTGGNKSGKGDDSRRVQKFEAKVIEEWRIQRVRKREKKG